MMGWEFWYCCVGVHIAGVWVVIDTKCLRATHRSARIRKDGAGQDKCYPLHSPCWPMHPSWKSSNTGVKC